MSVQALDRRFVTVKQLRGLLSDYGVRGKRNIKPGHIRYSGKVDDMDVYVDAVLRRGGMIEAIVYIEGCDCD